MDAPPLLNRRNRRLPAVAVRTALRPAGWLWRSITASRNALYDARLLPALPLSRPTLSVGNLTTGGTGKTPMVIDLVRRVRGHGHRPAVLHRGYGGGDRTSDEHLLYQACLDPEVPVVADPDRRAAATRTLAERPEITLFILDDGFQHRKVQRDLDLVLVDASVPLQEQRVLPAGFLREGSRGLRRADAVVLTHLEQIDDDAVPRLVRFIAPRAGDVPVIRARHVWRHLLRCDDGTLPISALAEARVVGACGIGNPGAFEAMVRHHAGATVAFHTFPDHHPVDHATAQSVLDAAHRLNADTVIMTEKDWMKWRSVLPELNRHGLELLRPALAITFDEGEEDLDSLLRTRLPVPEQG